MNRVRFALIQFTNKTIDMIPLSVIIITFNEERNILRCLQSVEGIADEVVVVDSFSTDRTKSICLENNVLFKEHAFESFNEQKNIALSYASHPFILSLDADEALSDELRKSILTVKENAKADGYTMNRLTNYCGTWIKHCWYPDKKLRLWNINKGRWDANTIHEKVEMQADTTIAHLSGDLLHYSYYTLEDHLIQLRKFTEIAALAAYNKGKRSSVLKLFYKPIVIFIKLYFFKKGFLDGYAGYVIARISAFGEFIKYARIRQLHKDSTPDKS